VHALAPTGDVDDLLVQGRTRLVEVRDEGADAALVAELVAHVVAPVLDADGQAGLRNASLERLARMSYEKLVVSVKISGPG